MQPYATWTRTRRNLRVMRRAGWGLLLSPDTLSYGSRPEWEDKSPARYCLDNGAWGAFQRSVEWPEIPFRELVAQYGAGADFTVCPDIVEGGQESLAHSLRWLPWCLERTPLVLIAVQDGMSPPDIAPHIGPRVGIFVGGSTEWKLSTMRQWGQLAHRRCHLHIGRVNTVRRITLCRDAGADSIDGTSVTRFAKTCGKLTHATRQVPLWSHHAPRQ